MNIIRFIGQLNDLPGTIGKPKVPILRVPGALGLQRAGNEKL